MRLAQVGYVTLLAFVATAACAPPAPICATSPRRAAPADVRRAQFASAALGRTMGYAVYLPPGYAAGTARYPVLYLLHGRGGGADEWRVDGLFELADAMIRRGDIQPIVMVTPEGEMGYWMNHEAGGPRWGDYITTDLIAHIDSTYRTRADANHRALGGISMGGHGAIELALHHPGLFAAVGGHSAVFRSQEQAFPFFGTGAAYAQHDPVAMVRDGGAAVGFALWLDIGQQDEWLARTIEFHDALVQRGIPHHWQLDPGAHERPYWRRHLPEYLRWYDRALREAATPHA